MYEVALIAAARSDFAGARRRLLAALAPGAQVSIATTYQYDDFERKTSAIVEQLAVMSGEQSASCVIEGRRP